MNVRKLIEIFKKDGKISAEKLLDRTKFGWIFLKSMNYRAEIRLISRNVGILEKLSKKGREIELKETLLLGVEFKEINNKLGIMLFELSEVDSYYFGRREWATLMWKVLQKIKLQDYFDEILLVGDEFSVEVTKEGMLFYDENPNMLLLGDAGRIKMMLKDESIVEFGIFVKYGIVKSPDVQLLPKDYEMEGSLEDFGFLRNY